MDQTKKGLQGLKLKLKITGLLQTNIMNSFSWLVSSVR